MVWLLLLSTLINYTVCSNDDLTGIKVKYLEELINSEVKKAENYKPRTDNRDLLNGAENSGEILDFGVFDFIIVGAGSSGSVLANRLTELRNWKVLILEAGDTDDDFTDIPYVFDVSALSDRNWGYLTVPQKNGCYGRINNQCPYIRGKVLGGSGTINGLVYSRGIKADFDKWAHLGNSGWSWNEVLPYYKKIENFESDLIDLKYRGFNGPLNVAYAKPHNPVQDAYIRANEEIGIKYIKDYNAKEVSGVSNIQHNIANGKRVSGSTSYVKRAWNRSNFNLTLKAFVTKILIDESNAAYGVQFVKNEKVYRAISKKEIILSAGAANSPQLLMLSGIGPEAELRKHKIRVIKNSPVGRYMKDHIGVLPFYLTSNFTKKIISRTELVKQYLKGIGLYTAPSHYRSISYYNTRNMSSPYPNFEIDFVPPTPIKKSFPQFANYKREISSYVESINASNSWNLQFFFLHPKSSGILSLNSSNPRDFPLIDSKIFEDPQDIEDMYQGIKVASKLLTTSVGKAFNLKLNINIPSCSREKFESRKFWYCILRQMALPAYHLLLKWVLHRILLQLWIISLGFMEFRI